MMEEKTYQIEFQNFIGSGRYFVTYKKFPKATSCKSHAWMAVGVPYTEDQDKPSNGKIVWSMDYDVTLVEEDVDGAVHFGNVTLKAKLGSAYVVNSENGFPQLCLDSDKDTPENAIEIRNNTSSSLTLGVNLGGNLLASQTTSNGKVALFDLSCPKYYVGITQTYPTGEFHSEIDPVEVQFLPGQNSAFITLEFCKGQEGFKEPVIYSYQTQEEIWRQVMIKSDGKMNSHIAISRSLWSILSAPMKEEMAKRSKKQD